MLTAELDDDKKIRNFIYQYSISKKPENKEPHILVPATRLAMRASDSLLSMHTEKITVDGIEPFYLFIMTDKTFINK
jgi:hypothetical protein